MRAASHPHTIRAFTAVALSLAMVAMQVFRYRPLLAMPGAFAYVLKTALVLLLYGVIITWVTGSNRSPSRKRCGLGRRLDWSLQRYKSRIWQQKIFPHRESLGGHAGTDLNARHIFDLGRCRISKRATDRSHCAGYSGGLLERDRDNVDTRDFRICLRVLLGCAEAGVCCHLGRIRSQWVDGCACLCYCQHPRLGFFTSRTWDYYSVPSSVGVPPSSPRSAPEHLVPAAGHD